MAERLSALAALCRPGSYGTIGPDGPGIVLAERHPLSIVQIAGFSSGAGETIAATLGAAPPASATRCASHGKTTILWVGPERWLVVEPETRDVAALLRPPLAGTAAVTDVANGRTTLRISGPRSRDLLAKGSAIDFHPRAFPVGACAQGLLGHVGALFHAVDDAPSFDLQLARSYAKTVWEFLCEAAAEYGYRVETAGRSP
jgi:heterotetrameric sarcosine oxidase gamma subunit